MRRRWCDPSRRLPTSRTVTAGSLRGEPQRQHEAHEDGQGAPPGPALGASDAFLSLGGLIHAVRLDGAVRRQDRIEAEPARGSMLPALCGENEPQRHGQQQNPPAQGERQGQTPLPRGVPETRGGQCQDSTGPRQEKGVAVAPNAGVGQGLLEHCSLQLLDRPQVYVGGTPAICGRNRQAHLRFLARGRRA